MELMVYGGQSFDYFVQSLYTRSYVTVYDISCKLFSVDKLCFHVKRRGKKLEVLKHNIHWNIFF